MTPLTLPSTLTQIWIDSSVQMIRSASEFWNGLLAVGSPDGTDRAVPRTSTAAPWWKAPEASQVALPALDPFAWASMWTPAAASKSAAPDVAGVWAATWAPWLPRASQPALPNGLEIWQQAWLRNMPQLAAFATSFARPAGLGAAWPAMWPTAPTAAASTAAVPPAWEPVMAAYRSANGHAMAAVLRTMADVVEPKSRQPDIMAFWPNALGTRH